MRRLTSLTTLLTIFPLLIGGCHHSAAPTGAPPLSPVGAGQAPTLSPFGGPTKVSPPPTGSYATPNVYMGTPAGTVPPGQISPMAPGTYPPQSNNAIGSGLQPGGWNSSDSSVAPASANMSTAPNAGVAPASSFGTTTAPAGPRTGGMPVTDLTGAPAPPGYRPSSPAINGNAPPPGMAPYGAAPYGAAPYGAAPQGVPANGYGTQPGGTYPPSITPNSGYPNSGYPGTTYPNYNPQNVSTPTVGNPSEEIASRLTPLPEDQFATPINPPSVQSVGTQWGGPTTEPINSAPTGADQNLMWRAPGSQF